MMNLEWLPEFLRPSRSGNTKVGPWWPGKRTAPDPAPPPITPQKPLKTMRDKVSIDRVNALHPAIRDEVRNLIIIAEDKLPHTAIRIVQGLRTFAEQDALYAQGRTKKGPKVTNSKGGQSFHNYGLAIDFALLYDKDRNGTFEALSWETLKDMDMDGEADWMEVVEIFEEAGYTWGGRFKSIKDDPHFEKTFGYNWKALLQLHEQKKFIPGTTYVRI